MSPPLARSPRLQHGAALLLAMLVMALVASLATAALWQQWRSSEIEQAQRERLQASWLLAGALDWARLILREDARTNQNTGSGDHLSGPWSVGLQEARLSSFLAMDKTQTDSPALDAFLSGHIQDEQARLNVTNWVRQGKLSEPDVLAFARLYELLGLPPSELQQATKRWLLAKKVSTPTGLVPAAGNLNAPSTGGTPSEPGVSAPTSQERAQAVVLPQRVEQLTWLGISAHSLQRLAPFVTLLPEPTPVNLNTASIEVLRACLPGLDAARAHRMLQQRALQPFKTISDVSRLWPALQEQLSEERHSTRSDYFMVYGRLRWSDRVVQEQSLVRRKGLEVQTLWRQRSATAPAEAPKP